MKHNALRNTYRKWMLNRNLYLCKLAFKLVNLWWSLIILIVALAMLVISFFLNGYECGEWLSNALISASCGCFTGLVFYFLSNLRNNKILKLQTEYNAINNVYVLINFIIGYL